VNPLALALKRRQWDLAALYLLLGISEAAAKLPPESLEAILDLLSQPEATKEDV